MPKNHQPLSANQKEAIVRETLAHFPAAQGVYLFGSYSTSDEWLDSDVELAVLLPDEAEPVGTPALDDLQMRLSIMLKRHVDLLNARLTSTIFQKAIIFGERIFCADRYAVDEFEMLTLSYFQKLNEERAEILAELRRTERVRGMNDIALDKAQAIRRFVQRAREEYDASDAFEADHTRQDAAVLNALLACEQAIALANHVIKTHQLGIPTSSDESFDLLATAGIIDPDLSARLQKMVGFRNAVVHHYQRMDLEIVRSVITTGLDGLMEFGNRVVEYLDA